MAVRSALLAAVIVSALGVAQGFLPTSPLSTYRGFTPPMLVAQRTGHTCSSFDATAWTDETMKSRWQTSKSRWQTSKSRWQTSTGGAVTVWGRQHKRGVRCRTSMGLGPLGPGGARPLLALAFVNAKVATAVGGGVLAGGLHAVSGPDHLAALLPRIMGQQWHRSMRIGAVWGLGHGFSATMIGLVAFFFKDRLSLGSDSGLVARMGTWTEGLVGVSLIAIGLLGLKESIFDNDDGEGVEVGALGHSQGQDVLMAGGAGQGAISKTGGQRAIFLNGILHGFSWDGAPSLAPALALTTWRGVLWFLMAYCSGTMIAMSATTTVIGEGSVRVGQALDQPDIPRKLSVISSFIAIAIGAVWLLKALFW